MFSYNGPDEKANGLLKKMIINQMQKSNSNGNWTEFVIYFF